MEREGGDRGGKGVEKGLWTLGFGGEKVTNKVAEGNTELCGEQELKESVEAAREDPGGVKGAKAVEETEVRR